jgi:predicted dehydrogenase
MKIAVVGAGVIGRVHINVIQAHPQCELLAVVDPTDTAKKFCLSQGISWFGNLDNLLKQTRPDGVILATPNVMHVTQALQCLETGAAVLIEKPIAHTASDAQRLIKFMQTMDGAGSPKILIGHHRAYSPIMAKAMAVIAEGRLGKLVSVIGSAMFFKPDHYFTDAPWRRLAGGGPILINLIHEIHNLRKLCGEIVEVQAMSSNAVRGFEVEDTAAINFRFASGVLGTFLVSDASASARSWEQTSQEIKTYPTYGDEDCYVLAGTLGSLAVPTMRMKTYPSMSERSWFKPFESSQLDLSREDPMALQLQHFVDVIQNNAEPHVSALDGLQNLLVVEAIQQSIQTKQTVALNAKFMD